MTTKQVVIAFLVLYLILMGVGGAMYYAVVNMPKHNVEKELQKAQPKNRTAQTANKEELDQAAKKKAEADIAAAKQKEAELAEQKKKEEAARIEKLKADIESKLKVVTRGGATYYMSNRGKELSGVHLRPFIVEHNGAIILKHDIYYHSALDDPNYGWIHGNHIDITADGQTYSFDLDASKRRDKLGKGAEDLTESYVMDADKTAEAMLKAVGNASNVIVRYYGESDTTGSLSREDIRRINEIMTYYDILQKEANGDI